MFLTSLQDSAYEGFAKFDSNSGTSQVRAAPPRQAAEAWKSSLEGALSRTGLGRPGGHGRA